MLTAVLGLLLVACVVYLILPRSLKLVYTLDSVHRASILPEGTWARGITCPYDGSPLTQIMLHGERGLGLSWRAAYICETEGIFWIADYSGGFSIIDWYGPFDGTWDEANILATIVAAISGTALAVFLAKQHTYKKPNMKTREDATSLGLMPPSWVNPVQISTI